MAFTYDPDTSRGTVRLLVGDTDSANAIFTDAEIDRFLALWGQEVHLAAAQAARSIAMDRAKLAIVYRVAATALEVDRRDVPKYFIELAKSLEAQARGVPWERESVFDHVISPEGVDSGVYMDTEGS